MATPADTSWRVGLVDWFAVEKGFGVAVSPDVGEVFIHKSNFVDADLNPVFGTALVFELAQERGKQSGKNVRRPAGTEDLTRLLALYGTSDDVHLKRRVPCKKGWGGSYVREERAAYDVVAVALKQVLKALDADEARCTLMRFAEGASAWEGSWAFERFFRFVGEELSGNLGGDSPLDTFKRELAVTALEAATASELFGAWQAARAHKNLNVRDRSRDLDINSLFGGETKPGSPFELPQEVLEDHVDRLTRDDLAYIGRMEDGPERLRRLLSKVKSTFEKSLAVADQHWLEALLRSSVDVYDEDEHDSFCRWAFGRCEEELLLALLKQRKRHLFDNESVLPLAGAAFADAVAEFAPKLIDGSGESEYFEVMETARERLEEASYEDLATRVHGQLDGDVVLRLWQSRRYFVPDADLLSKHADELTLKDLRAAPREWRRRYYEDRVRPLLPGSSLVDLVLLSGYCREDGELVFPIVCTRIEPIEHLAAFWLTFRGSPLSKNADTWGDEPLPVGGVQGTRAVEALVAVLTDPGRFTAFRAAYSAAFAVDIRWRRAHGSAERPFGGEGDRIWAEKMVAGEPHQSAAELFRAGLGALGREEIRDVLVSALVRASEYGLSFDEALDLATLGKLSEVERREVFDRAYDGVSDIEKVRLWIEGKTGRTDLGMSAIAFGTLSHDEQRQFFRRLFAGAVRNETTFDLVYLLDLIADAGDAVDLSVRVAARALESLAAEGRYLGAGALSDVIADYVGDRVEGIVQIEDLVGRCPGRAILRMTNGHSGEYPRGQWFAVIDGEHFPVHDDDVVIGDRYYSLDKQARTVEVEGKSYRFRWRKIEGTIGNGFYVSREDVPKGVTFCEGRKAQKRDDWSNREFHWCCNRPCFAPAQGYRHHFFWASFTLRDFIHILGLPFDQEGYDRFVAMLNRANRLLARLNCTGCRRLLRPKRSSEFAFYRVTTFHCTNEDCEARGKKVYLTHCLDWRCNGIVDSRVSAQCPNDWYICEECGGCCSHEKLRQRLENLEQVGAFDPGNWRHQKLAEQVANQLGHAERNMRFDFKTGNQLSGGGGADA